MKETNEVSIPTVVYVCKDNACGHTDCEELAECEHSEEIRGNLYVQLRSE